jgi:hypothetical protein
VNPIPHLEPKFIERVGGASQLLFFRESDPSRETEILAEILHLALRNPQKLWRHPLNRRSPTLNARVRVPPLEWDTVIRITVRGGDVIGWLRINVLSMSLVTIGFVVEDLIESPLQFQRGM